MDPGKTKVNTRSKEKKEKSKERKKKQDEGSGDTVITATDQKRKSLSSKSFNPESSNNSTDPDNGRERRQSLGGFSTSSKASSRSIIQKKRNSKSKTHLTSSNYPHVSGRKKSCHGIEDSSSESDDEGDTTEPFNTTKIGEEVFGKILTQARSICAERFYHENAPNFVTMELRDTWLRVMEMEWLDEYKPEIGRFTSSSFDGDLPPSTLPFDAWSRGTLELIDPNLRKVTSRPATATSLPRDNGSFLSQFNLPLPMDAVYPIDLDNNESWSMGFDEDDDELFGPSTADPSLTVLFRSNRRKVFSTTKLLPEDGFNIPIRNNYSSTNALYQPPKENFNFDELEDFEDSVVVITGNEAQPPKTHSKQKNVVESDKTTGTNLKLA